MSWLFNSLPIQDTDVPKKAIGFIYVITCPDGKRYLGRKMLTKSKTKQTKGVKKKIKVESDWKEYWSSSPELLAMVAEKGTDGFKREIIYFAYSRAEMMYLEECLLYHVNALLDDTWINGNIRSKIFESWFTKNKSEFIKKVTDLKNSL